MARKVEFIKKSEARIIIYLINAKRPLRSGKWMSLTLKIDYIYIMKLLRSMYDRGWVSSHRYSGETYFGITLRTPIMEAKKKLSISQLLLKKEEVD